MLDGGDNLFVCVCFPVNKQKELRDEYTNSLDIISQLLQINLCVRLLLTCHVVRYDLDVFSMFIRSACAVRSRLTQVVSNVREYLARFAYLDPSALRDVLNTQQEEEDHACVAVTKLTPACGVYPTQGKWHLDACSNCGMGTSLFHVMLACNCNCCCC